MLDDERGQLLLFEVNRLNRRVHCFSFRDLKVMITDTVQESPVIESSIFHIRSINPTFATVVSSLANV